MKLKRLLIEATANDGDHVRCYSWTEGQELFDLECAIRALQTYLDEQRAASAVALNAQQPI